MNTEAEIEGLKSLADIEDFVYRNNTRGLSRKDCKTITSLMAAKLKQIGEREDALRVKLWGAAAGWAKSLVGKA